MSSSETQQDTIIVTGASSGIGAAIALNLAGRGYKVACLSRRGTTPEVNENLFGITCDVSDPKNINDAVAKAATLGNGLYGLVNCAGMQFGGPSKNFSLQKFESILKVNVIGLFAISQAVYPHLEKHQNGLIINIGSFWDKVGGKGYAAYCASKAAVGAISRVLAVEWARKGIRVLDVAPGYIKTEMTETSLEDARVADHLAARIPRGEVGAPEDIAKLIGALFKENITFLTGSTIYVDGAQGIAP